jgi:uncharacterized heparinase superfamily protein
MNDPQWYRLVQLARTAQLLQPSQVGHRVRLRAQRQVLRALPAPFAERHLRSGPVTVAAWPLDFISVGRRAQAGSASADDNAAGWFDFLGDRRHLGRPPDWSPADASQLWRYHLHYFEWAWAFARHDDRAWARSAFAELWCSWRASSRFGRWDEWSPYVASLRAWVLCDLFADLIADSAIEDEVVASIDAHHGFLRHHLERDVGGNHLLKNLKALLGLGVFLDRPSTVRAAVEAIDEQIRVQVLADGGHYELTPAYHCQVLADLVDLVGLTSAAEVAVPPTWPAAVERMRHWLGVMRFGSDALPRFNDTTAVPSRLQALLRPPPRAPGLQFLPASGYAVLDGGGRLSAVVDVAEACPPGLPAHAHADCLSVEVAVDGRPVLVNTGTSTYVPGARRRFERSTRAHNTIEVDGADQTEVWGTFRAARRAHPTVHDVSASDGLRITASHDGYRRLPGSPVHTRTVRLGPDDLVVDDRVDGSGYHRAVLCWHFAAGKDPVLIGSHRVSLDHLDLVVEPSGPHRLDLLAPGSADRAQVADGFGRLRPAAVVEIRLEGVLPLSCRTVITAPPR